MIRSRKQDKQRRRMIVIRKIIKINEDKCNGGGLQRAAENALRASGKFLPWQVVTVSVDGRILD